MRTGDVYDDGVLYFLEEEMGQNMRHICEGGVGTITVA